ncbi:tetratricopeptide repeat protein [Streptomyces indicus]|uniref:Tetratricopeptide repeat-containing protein n=1 Tax=Streptomyces indicus TaxID=417292 RepID=A0A1G8UCE6_9ACTN|nr:tetratricopeptide repeat protein [Streptomyces indicus]SDJ51254.1 Tetratricopeptide repeat-containing protein [Streptomyces indicus]
MDGETIKEQRARQPRRRKAAATAVACAVVGGLTAGLISLGPEAPPRPAQGAVPVTAGAQDLGEQIAARRAWLREHPKDATVWAGLAAGYIEQARRSADFSYHSRAEEALERALALSPGHVPALVGMGALANARHDFAAARTWGERAQRAEPGNWTVYPVLADAYTQLGRYPQATAAVQRLLDLKPGVPAFTRAAYELEMQGRTDEAAEALRRALEDASDPADRAFCLHRLGELDWERGRVAPALARYEEALRADPAAHAALAGRAKARAALGRTEDALADYRTVTGRVPLPEYVLAYGELLESLGRGAEARRQYEVLRAQIRLLEAQGAEDDLTLGLFEADHGDARAAVERLRAEWSRRRSVLVADALAWALHRAGRPAEAAPLARTAAALGWRPASFAYHRGEIARALGDEAGARKHLHEALRINPHFSPLKARAARAALRAGGGA